MPLKREMVDLKTFNSKLKKIEKLPVPSSLPGKFTFAAPAADRVISEK